MSHISPAHMSLLALDASALVASPLLEKDVDRDVLRSVLIGAAITEGQPAEGLQAHLLDLRCADLADEIRAVRQGASVAR